MKNAIDPKYPYYLKPAIDALPTATGEERKALVRRIAAGIGYRPALRTLLGIDPDEFRDFYGDNERAGISTEDTISGFIDRFAPGAAGEIPEEIPIAPPAVDYAAMLEASGDQHENPADAEPDVPILSLDLAKIMVKNGNYRKALEIIKGLNLKNPKKSIYFADQIRFLEMLIRTQVPDAGYND